jgi:hypothetical protein
VVLIDLPFLLYPVPRPLLVIQISEREKAQAACRN